MTDTRNDKLTQTPRQQARPAQQQGIAGTTHGPSRPVPAVAASEAREQQSAQDDGTRRKRRPVGFWVAIAVAVAAVVIACVFAFQAADDRGLLPRDPSQASGQLEGKSEAEIQEELNRVVDEGMFNITISSEIEMESGDAEAPVFIENVPGNRYLMRVSIVREDTGDVLYESGIIEPNHHISKVRLAEDLPQGEYDCVANFTAYDAETEEEVGQAAALVKIKVKS